MADPYVGMGLNAINYGLANEEYIRDTTKRHYRRMRGKSITDQPKDRHIRDHRLPEEMGYELKRRCDVQSDEEVVEVVRHRGEVLPQRPGRPANTRRSSSYDDHRSSRAIQPYNRRRGGGGRGDGYDSEGSVPPRSRVRARSQGGRSRRRRSSSSSSSSSDLGSTTEEEKEMKKIHRKKWITAGLATVATVHAVAKVHSSVKAHDKRVTDLATGAISPEEANKQARRARWQDAAAVAIAGLGIKGAYSEWKEVREENQHHHEMLEAHEQAHLKRLEHERQRKARDNGGYYKATDGNWYYNGQNGQYSENSRNPKMIDYGTRRGSEDAKSFKDTLADYKKPQIQKARHDVVDFGGDALEEIMEQV